MHVSVVSHRFALVMALTLLMSAGGVAYASIPNGGGATSEHARTAGAPVYTDWSIPVNLGSTVNSAVLDSGPAISNNGLSLYFYSPRPGLGGNDIWVSHRASLDGAWGAPVNLAVINTAAGELVPSFSSDGHWMFFASDRPGGFGMADIWASWRADTNDDFGWTAPVNLGANVNTAWNDNGTGYFANEGGQPLLFFGSDRPGGLGGTDLYMSPLRADGTWGPSTHIVELSSSGNDNRPQISANGLEIFMYSDRAGGAGTDIWTATRASLDGSWSTPANVGAPVNSSGGELHPYLSADGLTLYFSSSRAGGSGSLDLFVTTRTQILPTGMDDCKGGGWEIFGVFKNQGDCVSFIASHGKDAPD